MKAEGGHSLPGTYWHSSPPPSRPRPVRTLPRPADGPHRHGRRSSGVVSLCVTLLCLLPLPPVTSAAQVTYQLREEQASGTFVGNMERDMLLQQELSPQDAVNLEYTLSTAGAEHAGLFAINASTSTLTTAERIDREAVCPGQADCSVTLDIAVYRRGPSSLDLFKLWKAVVNVNDINDNAPAFPQPRVALSVPESVPPQHVLHTSGAEDKDTGGSNSVQRYELSPPNPLFGLNVVRNPDGSSDLGIVIREQLDREAQDSYQLQVIATDGGHPQRTGSLTVDIAVADVNDNRPVFLQSRYNVSVRENVAADVPILTVQARDDDAGPNGRLTYGFSPRVTDAIRTRLTIDASTGAISARGPVDFEVTPQFQFLVEARDAGSPQLSGAALVVINVLDVNDHAPQIAVSLTPGGNNLTEAEAVGKFIAHVSVSDRDSGRNGMVVCSMDDDHFELQKFYDHSSNVYKVLLSNPLDFESSPLHRVTVTCLDSGQPPLANSTSFVVHVTDVNDNAPVFSQPSYSASVVENQLDVEDLLQVSAHDVDTGLAGEVTYALDSDHNSNVSRIFSLHPTSGLLQVRSPLNREEHAQYAFHVLASDRGTPPLTSSVPVVITVLDRNDEKPYFVRSWFDCYVLERQPAGTRVCNVTATDDDSADHAAMRYSVLPGVGHYRNFAIDSATGTLRTRGILDRERQAVYRVVVKVEDPEVPLFYDLANVTIHVLDDNDHSPVILFPTATNNSVNVTYGARIGSRVTQVLASDDDDDIFGRLSYLVAAGDPSRLFELQQRSGVLLLARSLVPDDVKEHVLSIRVQDGGTPSLFNITELRVHVLTGNMTLLRVTDDDDHNMLIVIILVCVTATLALAVLVTICIIRRMDRERTARRQASKAEEEKMFRLKNQDPLASLAAHNPGHVQAPSGHSSRESSATSSSASSHSVSGSGVNGVNGLGGKGRKKEVSFSVDEGVESLDTSSGSGALSTFKSPPGAVFHKDVHPHETGLSVTCPPLTSRIDPVTLGVPMSQRMTSEDGQIQAVHDEEGCQMMEMLKRSGEDALSESSGETGTSDSGRGGSEDDCHSNRGSAMIEPDGPAVYPNVFLRGSLATPGGHDSSLGKGRHYANTRGSHHSNASGSGRTLRQHSPHVSFSGNLEYLGESCTDGDVDYPAPPPDLIRESPPPPPPPYSDFSTFGSPRGGSGYVSVLHSHPRNPGYGGVSTSLVKHPSSPSPAPSLSGMPPPPPPHPHHHPLQEGGGRQRWGSPSFNDEDDRTTSTTSGSYVINPDDLRKEIDDLILNDMIV